MELYLNTPIRAPLRSERELTAERTYKLLPNVRGADVADMFHRVTIELGYDFQVQCRSAVALLYR